MVSKFASEHNIEFFTTRFETKTYARENGLSVQMAARELRYTWFEKIRKEHGYDSIAVAHNLNDNIETLLINLIRGTGVAGLTGMKPSANKIIRPLLICNTPGYNILLQPEQDYIPGRPVQCRYKIPQKQNKTPDISSS